MKNYQYAFVALGSATTAFEAADNLWPLFFDVGDANTGTVFDHHHGDEEELGSATAIVSSPKGRKRLTALRAQMEAEGRTPVFVTHREPDMDAVAAVYAALSLWRQTPALHPDLVAYITHKDRGHKVDDGAEKSISFLFSQVTKPASDDHERMMKGLELIDCLNEVVCEGQLVPGRSDIASVPVLCSRYSAAIMAFERSAQKLQALEKKVQVFKVQLLSKDGKTVSCTGCLLRFSEAEPPVPGFKEHFRTLKSSSGESRYSLLFVFTQLQSRCRAVISVTPESGLQLEGLGRLLDEAEERKSRMREELREEWSAEEVETAGQRVSSTQVGATLIRDTQHPRPGYENSDPWYDGRGHDWTIVDSPHSGTVLDDKEVLEVLCKFTQCNLNGTNSKRNV